MRVRGGWVLEVDIRKFFDTIPKKELTEIIRHRVRDGVLLRIIGKWLNAGVMENGCVTHPETGTPQGGVISPLLANIFLHEVMDTWFESVVRNYLKGYAVQIRYADDIVMIFAREDDARRVLKILPKRFGKHGLTLHPVKTKLVNFTRPNGDSPLGPKSFDFLGFTHYWGKSLKKYWVVMQKTARDRFSRALHQIREWCKAHRHEPLARQQRGLKQKLQGHYQYFGISQNYKALARFLHETQIAWRKWLSRRSNAGKVDWEEMHGILKRFPLPTPRITHRYTRSKAVS
jgi:group II intron reverse transcriptase/maturase